MIVSAVAKKSQTHLHQFLAGKTGSVVSGSRRAETISKLRQRTLSIVSSVPECSLPETGSILEETFLEDTNAKWCDKLTLADPKSAFTSNHGNRYVHQSKETLFNHLEKSCDDRGNFYYSLSLASTQNDFTNPVFLNLLDERMKRQLKQVSYRNDPKQSQVLQDKKEKYSLRDSYDLPRNLHDATQSDDQRAIVITEKKMPFRIVSVNSAWETLCGYTAAECNGQTLSCIQGPDTNTASITALMAQLLRGEKAGTILTNYKKDGSKFRNHLSVGPLEDHHGNTTHFVGVLKEIQDSNDLTNHMGKKANA